MVTMSQWAESTARYKHYIWEGQTWPDTARRVSSNVFSAIGDQTYEPIVRYAIETRRFMPGGRYLYATGRQYHQTQNCLLLKAHDSREGWAELLHKAGMALMTGAGIGVDYSDVREEGRVIKKTGGFATGPIALMQMLNECGRGIMQGGSRRCLLRGAPVTMADGSRKPVEAIRVGDGVLTRFGARQVVGTAFQGVQEVFRVKTKHGEVLSSGNHRWLGAKKDRTTQWVETKKLKPGWALYLMGSPVKGGEPVDPNFAYTLGYYLGNGCAYTSNRTHEVTFSLPDAHVTDNQLKTLELGMSRYGAKMAVVRGHGACINVRFRSKKLVGLFQKFKSPNQSFTVPEEIVNSNIDGRAAFLAGWCDADGSLHEGRKVRVACKHNKALESFGSLAKSLGLVTSQSGNEINFKSSQNGLWNDTIGKFTYKYGPLPVNGGGLVKDEILSIESVGSYETFDLQIDEVEEFVAYDHVSHNSAIWAGLRWDHSDVLKFCEAKNWSPEVRALKEKNFSFPATLDQTNISVQLNDEFFKAYTDPLHPKHALASSVYWLVVRQMSSTAEPGFSVDCGGNAGETLRNACNEVTSSDSDDICNLGSINMGAIDSQSEFREIVRAATAFLLAGTVYSDVPYFDVDKTRSKNRRLGLGLMGIHEWLLKRGKPYAPDDELGSWLATYENESRRTADRLSEKWGLSRPVKVRAIAPTGTISIVAETTSGIEPVFCVAYKRRFLKGGKYWAYQYVVDPAARRLIEKGIPAGSIEDAYSLATDVERRVHFQWWVQTFVDHGISSTINLPSWGSELNNEDTVTGFGQTLMKYLPGLRGMTCYPDGSRGGQPLTPVPYEEAVSQQGIEFVESSADICSIAGKGSCGD